jgi:hypothetical protein
MYRTRKKLWHIGKMNTWKSQKVKMCLHCCVTPNGFRPNFQRSRRIVWDQQTLRAKKEWMCNYAVVTQHVLSFIFSRQHSTHYFLYFLSNTAGIGLIFYTFYPILTCNSKARPFVTNQMLWSTWKYDKTQFKRRLKCIDLSTITHYLIRN